MKSRFFQQIAVCLVPTLDRAHKSHVWQGLCNLIHKSPMTSESGRPIACRTVAIIKKFSSRAKRTSDSSLFCSNKSIICNLIECTCTQPIGKQVMQRKICSAIGRSLKHLPLTMRRWKRSLNSLFPVYNRFSVVSLSPPSSAE